VGTNGAEWVCGWVPVEGYGISDVFKHAERCRENRLRRNALNILSNDKLTYDLNIRRLDEAQNEQKEPRYHESGGKKFDLNRQCVV